MPTLPTQSPAFYTSAPVKFSVNHLVRASPDEVFAALEDTANWPKWFTTLNAAAWTSDAPHGVGSTRRVKAGPVAIDEEFIVWEPGRRWGFTMTATSVPAVSAGAELVELTAEGDGTRVTYSMFLDPLPGLGWLTKLTRRGVEGGLLDGLKGLDRYLAAT